MRHNPLTTLTAALLGLVFLFGCNTDISTESVAKAKSESPQAVQIVLSLGGESRAQRFLGSYDQIEDITLDVVRNYGNKTVQEGYPLTRDNVTGNWSGVIPDLILNFDYTITAHAYRAYDSEKDAGLSVDNVSGLSRIEIFRGEEQHTVSEGVNQLSMTLAPLMDSRNLRVPQITRINRPFQMEQGTTSGISVEVITRAVDNNSSEGNLSFRFLSVNDDAERSLDPTGGTFNPDFGDNITCSSGYCDLINTDYTAPDNNTPPSREIQVRVSNDQDVGVIQHFNIYITGNTDFNDNITFDTVPVVEAIYAERINEGLKWVATISNEDNVTVSWMYFPNPSMPARTFTNYQGPTEISTGRYEVQATLDGYQDTDEGQLLLIACEGYVGDCNPAIEGSTTVSVLLKAGYYQKPLICDNEGNCDVPYTNRWLACDTNDVYFGGVGFSAKRKTFVLGSNNFSMTQEFLSADQGSCDSGSEVVYTLKYEGTYSDNGSSAVVPLVSDSLVDGNGRTQLRVIEDSQGNSFVQVAHGYVDGNSSYRFDDRRWRTVYYTNDSSFPDSPSDGPWGRVQVRNDEGMEPPTIDCQDMTSNGPTCSFSYSSSSSNGYRYLDIGGKRVYRIAYDDTPISTQGLKNDNATFYAFNGSGNQQANHYANSDNESIEAYQVDLHPSNISLKVSSSTGLLLLDEVSNVWGADLCGYNWTLGAENSIAGCTLNSWGDNDSWTVDTSMHRALLGVTGEGASDNGSQSLFAEVNSSLKSDHYPSALGCDSYATDNYSRSPCENRFVSDSFYNNSSAFMESIVQDYRSGMIWMPHSAGDISYQSAVESCDNSSYAGIDSWRLPTEAEVLSITSAAYTHFSNIGEMHIWTTTQGSQSGTRKAIWVGGGDSYDLEESGSTRDHVCVAYPSYSDNSGDSYSSYNRFTIDNVSQIAFDGNYSALWSLAYQNDYSNGTLCSNYSAAGIPSGNWYLPDEWSLSSLRDSAGPYSVVEPLSSYFMSGSYWTSTADYYYSFSDNQTHYSSATQNFSCRTSVEYMPNFDWSSMYGLGGGEVIGTAGYFSVGIAGGSSYFDNTLTTADGTLSFLSLGATPSGLSGMAEIDSASNEFYLINSNMSSFSDYGSVRYVTLYDNVTFGVQWSRSETTPTAREVYEILWAKWLGQY